MEPLEPAGFSSYGYEPYPCGFRHIVEELEKMAGTDVNVTIQEGMIGPEIVRMSGRLGLAKELPNWSPARIGYAVGDEESEGFQICEEQFSRGQLIPGMIWIETGPHILIVERQHFPPEMDEGSPD